MNYLAHCVLSGSDEQILLGNFIGDFVKGKNYEKYPKRMQKGILLHRHIDSFTDNSEIVKQSKSYFADAYGKYSGVIVDIIYDHFLSVHWRNYSNLLREVFIQNTYNTLLKYYASLPARAQKLLPPIIYYNWLRYYASFYGIEKVLDRMTTRTSLPNETQACMAILRINYSRIDQEFKEFFAEIQKDVV